MLEVWQHNRGEHSELTVMYGEKAEEKGFGLRLDSDWANS